MSLLFSTEKLFTNDSIELLTKQNDKNKKIIYELKCENAKLMERIKELEKSLWCTATQGLCLEEQLKHKIIVTSNAVPPARLTSKNCRPQL